VGGLCFGVVSVVLTTARLHIDQLNSTQLSASLLISAAAAAEIDHAKRRIKTVPRVGLYMSVSLSACLCLSVSVCLSMS